MHLFQVETVKQDGTVMAKDSDKEEEEMREKDSTCEARAQGQLQRRQDRRRPIERQR